ncbi:MAG: hypothetical protein IH599_07420, partial [Bacteroidales bacterium]|nr:hypothetical protein [Bacteroidales bacterium]
MYTRGKSTGPFPILLLNSIVTNLLALLMITALHLGVTAFTAMAYHIPMALDLTGFSFPISNYSS